jgi:hypothetical protein
MASRAALRASDSDRERVAERLREATAEGRLRTEELEQRLESALSASTYGQLDALVADLPGSRVIAPRERALSQVRPALTIALSVVLALTVVAAVLLAVSGVVAAWWLWALAGWWFFGRRRCRPYGVRRRHDWYAPRPPTGPSAPRLG